MAKHASFSLVAMRYARSLLMLVDGKEGSQEIVESYRLVFDRLVELFQIQEANNILRSPVMAKELKLQLLELALKADGKYIVNETFVRFVKGVLDADRVELIPKIAEAYENLLMEKRNEKRATLVSARQLPHDLVIKIEEKLNKFFGKKILLTMKVDKSLLGGFVVQVGNYLLDFSLRSAVDYSIK